MLKNARSHHPVPSGGISKVENILKNPLIKVELDTDFKDIKNQIEYERLFFSGAIDEYFNYELGRLPYRSLDIEFRKHNCEYLQSGPQINFPENYDYTRSVEYKYYLDEKSNKTIVSYEYPCPYEEGKNERYYPIPDDDNQKLYNQYLNKAKELKNVYFIGRLGDYKYYNMDQTVASALELFEGVKK